MVNQPSRASRCKTSGNVVRVTPINSESSRSAGRIDPGGKRLFQILSIMYSSAKPAGLCALITMFFTFRLGHLLAIRFSSSYQTKMACYSALWGPVVKLCIERHTFYVFKQFAASLFNPVGFLWLNSLA